MSNFFNLDNPFFQTMSKVFDLILVSVLWVFCCFPVITIGPATAALYYVVAKVVRRERGYVYKEFFRAFKENFITGTVYTIVLVVMAFLFYMNFSFVHMNHTKTNAFLFYMYWMMLFVIGCITVYVFPLLSRFHVKPLQLVKMSLFMALKHLPRTLIMLVFVLITGFTMFIMPPLSMILPGVCALLCSFQLEKVMKLYLPKPEEGIPKEELEWYYTFQ